MHETVDGFDGAPVGHPKLRALHDFWHRCRGEGVLPRRSAIPAEQFKPWMGHMMILEPVGESVAAMPRFRVRLHGTRLYGYDGKDLTGWFIDDVVGEPGLSCIVAPYAAAVNARAPQYDVIRSPFPGGTVHQLCRLVLPCAEDGHQVDRLLVGMYLHAQPRHDPPPHPVPPDAAAGHGGYA
jgi:hypothetical protein